MKATRCYPPSSFGMTLRTDKNTECFLEAKLHKQSLNRKSLQFVAKGIFLGSDGDDAIHMFL